MSMTRNDEILHRFDGGETLEAIGSHYGITRERVRQIVKKNGGKPRRQQSRDRDEAAFKAIEAAKLTRQQAVEQYGASVVRRAELHVQFAPTPHKHTSAEVTALVERVRAGESIKSICGGRRALESNVAYACQKFGIKSRHGKAHDRSARNAIILAMRQAGATWKVIAAAIASAEGKPITPTALHLWAQRHIGEIVCPPSKRAPRQIRLPRPPRPRVEYPVIRAETPKEAARLNYGQAPASAIAAAHGVSRNSIIGHWFRLRRAGVIA